MHVRFCKGQNNQKGSSMITKKGKPTNKTNSTFPIFQPQKIVDCRMQGDTQEYQVKWSSIHFLSWETSTNLHNCPIYKKENTKLIQVIAFLHELIFLFFLALLTSTTFLRPLTTVQQRVPTELKEEDIRHVI